MLARVKQFFELQLAPEQAEDSEQAVRLAACALLFEMVKADYQVNDSELQAMREAIKRVANIDDSAADSLIAIAQSESDSATSLYQFSHLINGNYSPAQKYKLLEALWQIAYADGQVDKYEEHYLRKISELLYIPHSEFIQAKLAVLDKRKG